MVARADAITLLQPYSIGRGTVEVFTITAPGAGNTATRTTAQGFAERLLAVTFTLSNSAVVNNRTPFVRFLDGDSNEFASAVATSIQPASNAVTYCAAIANQNTGNLGQPRNSFIIPSLWLVPGWRFNIGVLFLDAGDTITGIRGLIERVSLGQDGYPIGETRPSDTERGRGYARALESE